VAGATKSLGRAGQQRAEQNCKWAERDLLAVIACNGAGKSILLKIFSRTPAPSIGPTKIKGCVGSLMAGCEPASQKTSPHSPLKGAVHPRLQPR
jgi:ABC-type hemin transport system ATPase subunit